MTDTQIRNMMETINTIKKSLEIDGGLAFEYYKALLEVGYERDVTYENKLNQFKSEMKNFRKSVEVKLEELDKTTKVNMSKNNWITGSSTGDTIKGVLDKEFDTAKGVVTGGTIDAGGKMAMFHEGDIIVPSEEALKLVSSSKVLENIMKIVTPAISKLNESHETESANDNKEVSDALDKAVDVFNIVFNINEETKKSAQDLVKDMANEMKNRGKWQ